MKFGTGFPLALPEDPIAARDLAQTYDDAGFDYVSGGSHILATAADRYTDRPVATYVGPYTDAFVGFSYLSAHTKNLHFITGILIMPLYQTALLARQATDLDMLSGGRFELGVGISWQESEYVALGQDLHTRGARLAEQIELLRLFWTQPLVTFKGKFHDIDNMGLNRLPKKPITIWIGSSFEERPMRRAARLGDGWMPMGDPTEQMPRFKEYLSEAGRDSIQLMTRLVAGDGGPDAWIADAKRLQGIGATHITIGGPQGLTGADATKRIMEARTALASALG